MDGELHHVAGTYQAGTASLYIDGEKVAFNTSASLAAEPAGSIYIGCWANTGLHHNGLIDEARLSKSVRYADNFSPSPTPFTLDEQTVHLWHFDEGEHDTAKDDAALADAYLSNVQWVNSPLTADDTAAR